MQFEKDRKLFLESFPGKKMFQTFPDNPKKKTKINLIRQFCLDEESYPIDGDIDFTKTQIPYKIIQGLDTLNDIYGAGIFLTINETTNNGRKATDIVKVRSVFIDLDDVGLPQFDERPSMVTETSPGNFHAYYLTTPDNDKTNVPLQSFKTIQESMIHKYKSDPVVKDLSRVMRCVGWYHQKGERFLSRIVDYTGKRFEFGFLIELFPPLPVKQFSAPKWQPTTNGDSAKEFKGTYGASKGGRNHHLIKRIGGMLKKNLSWSDIEQETFKEAQSCSPPLSERETRAVLKSARRYA